LPQHRRAVKRHLLSDVPVGILLSGGLDSSVIVALMAQAMRPAGGRVLTSTVGFDVPEYDESADARLVADHVGADHEEVPVSQGDVENSILDVLGRPCLDVDPEQCLGPREADQEPAAVQVVEVVPDERSRARANAAVCLAKVCSCHAGIRSSPIWARRSSL